jgi:hypothetical protein
MACPRRVMQWPGEGLDQMVFLPRAVVQNSGVLAPGSDVLGTTKPQRTLGQHRR